MTDFYIVSTVETNKPNLSGENSKFHFHLDVDIPKDLNGQQYKEFMVKVFDKALTMFVDSLDTYEKESGYSILWNTMETKFVKDLVNG